MNHTRTFCHRVDGANTTTLVVILFIIAHAQSASGNVQPHEFR